MRSGTLHRAHGTGRMSDEGRVSTSSAESLPFVSCLITTYNYGRYVGEALDSVLAQDYPADRREIIVVDDGSTDDTPQVLARYADRVKIIRQANAGVCAATERGLSETRGELIATLDADDVWLPGKLHRQVARM